VVVLEITAPINKLKAASCFAHHTTPRARAKRTKEKLPMLGLAQNGSDVGVGPAGVEAGGVTGGVGWGCASDM